MATIRNKKNSETGGVCLSFFLSLICMLTACQDDNSEKETQPEEKKSVFRFIDKANITNTNIYEKAGFCLRIYYPKEDYTKFINDFIYADNIPDTLDYTVPALYEGCIYEYRIFLSNKSWDAPRKSKEYRFKEVRVEHSSDSVHFEYPKDTINTMEALEISRL